MRLVFHSKMLGKVLVAIFSTSCLLGVYTQENAGSSVASYLMECYRVTDLLDRDRRLPSTMNCLIDLIRKVEGATVQDARQHSIQLIHRFRQDGIRRSSSNINFQYSLPFSPTGKQTFKNRLLLRQLIPGTAVNFPNETLNALEKCSLHFMLSRSVDAAKRGDESTVCNRLGRYERRSVRSVQEDVEIIHPLKWQERGNLEEGEPEPNEPSRGEEIEQDGSEFLSNPNLERSTPIATSECPVENGVVYTRWGAVQSGTVISGIAAGLEPQTITEGQYQIDNRFAATLSGAISEATLFQTGREGDVKSIGATGGWNSTQVPRWYFVTEQKYWEMTDADIRASLDGLVMALNVQDWKSKFSTIKLSQILDMYYSRRGVFSDKYRACNRKNLLTEVAPSDKLKAQTTGFSILFDKTATFSGSILEANIPILSDRAVEMFLAYAPTINDLNCQTDESSGERIATDIIIVLDTQWPHRTIHPALSYLLDNLDINKFGSNFTIINGNDGRVILNSSDSVLDYHQKFNLTVQQGHPTGFQFSRMYNEVEQIVRNKMDEDRSTGNVGGRSSIVLFVPYQSTVSDDDKNFATERREIYKSFLPDIKFLVLGFGSKDSYSSLVSSSAYDVFTLPDSSDGTSIVSAVSPLIKRIQEIPRRIINPNCGSDFSGSSSSNSFEQYIEPQTVNFYRIAPNYFFGDGDRTLSIRGQGNGPIVVCTSTEESQPRQNQTGTSDLNCKSVNSNEGSFSLSGLCTDGPISSCSPFYFSVESSTPNTNPRCSDAGCRFPDNIKYTIKIDGFGCSSSGTKILGSFLLVLLSYLLS